MFVLKYLSIMENDRKRQGKNLMTEFTFRSLQEEIRRATSERDQSLLDIGEAAGSESNWHDNAAFDHANMKHDLDSSRLSTLQSKIRDVQFIEPRKKTDRIEIGNKVIVKFEGEEENESFVILGPDDSGKQTGWISFISPLGGSLMGKKGGDAVSYMIGKQEQKIKIIQILPGDF